MEPFNEKDRSHATYRSKDPIKNLKIRVNLKRLSSATFGFETQQAEGELPNPPVSTNQLGQIVLDEETIIVHWQQKFFSQREVDFYGFEPNCSNVTDYKYHAEIEKLKQNDSKKNKRLFTYVENDRFAFIDDVYTPMTTSENETPSILMKRIINVRKRRAVEKQTAPPAWELNKPGDAAGLKLVESQPTEEFKDNHHLINTPVHTFMIMADLSPEGQLGSAEFEHPLCIIEYDDNGVMRIFPDFSNFSYRIKEGALTRDIWEYTVENGSAAVGKIELRREAKMISELYQKHQVYLMSLVGEEFEELPNQLFRLVTFGEFVSAESFDYNHLHIEYFLDLPNFWTSDPAQLLSGCTQTCATTLQDNKEVAYFSHPFDYQMFLNLSDEDVITQLVWPKIFLHVISLDTWGRRRTEGYGYFSLPTRPGLHKIVVQCWRPIGNAGYPNVRAELRRYFIGGNPELEDNTYTAVPSIFEGKILSKYGVRCVASGCIRLSINCIQQCKGFQDDVSSAISKKKWQTALQLARGRATQQAIHGVMEAYQRARRRMQLARETVPTKIREAAAKTAEEKLKESTMEERIKTALMKTKIE